MFLFALVEVIIMSDWFLLFLVEAGYLKLEELSFVSVNDFVVFVLEVSLLLVAERELVVLVSSGNLLLSAQHGDLLGSVLVGDLLTSVF